MPEQSYGFANKRTAWETIAPLLDRASPLRTAHMRDPVGPQIHFASESFMDEVAAALNMDPVEFRLRYVTDPRDVAVIKAAAEKAGWQTRPSPRKDQAAIKVSGRGIAYAQRGPTRVAIVAEVEVDRSTGRFGRASSRWRTIAARSSIRTACITPSKATWCRRRAARFGKRSSSTPTTSPASIGGPIRSSKSTDAPERSISC